MKGTLGKKTGDGITAEAILEFMDRKAYRPLTLVELAQALGLGPKKKDRRVLERLIKELTAAGKVVETRTHRFGVPHRMNLVVGRLQGHPKGYGFVIPDREDQDEVFIPPAALGTAMHNDRVIARVSQRADGHDRRAEGEIIRILERANREIVGRLDSYGKYGFVSPMDPRLHFEIFIPPKGMAPAQTGDVVIVEILSWPDRRRNPEGRIIEILGDYDDPGIDVDVIVFNHGLRHQFPAAVLEEAERLPQYVRPEDFDGRRDLRSLLTVTIDGDDAKDLDDAVSLEPGTIGKWRLGVHIADVSHYVREGSRLDQEAYQRGTSVYLVDRVIPMLPEALSNGICSLNPGQDRLTVSVFMEIDAQGEVMDYEIVPSVIRSAARLTYSGVYRLLAEGDPGPGNEYAEYASMLQQMHELSQLLFSRRLQRGAVDFDFPEPKVILDENGKAVDIVTERRNLATQIIEEFMILCNEVVARHHAPIWPVAMYRIHEPPDPETIAGFEEFLSLFGERLRTKADARVTPRDFQKLLQRIAHRPEQYLLSSVALRTMERAKYSSENKGHFGLASSCYAHFTAPIRRYPDLVLHRIVKATLASSVDQAWRDNLVARLPEIARHTSIMERTAEEAERDSVDLKKAEFMESKLGDVFTGIISGVTNFGFFVQLPNTVEGLVHVSTITDDYYHLDAARYTLRGERTGRAFRLGDKVTVQVIRVSRHERSIDFQLVEDDAP